MFNPTGYSPYFRPTIKEEKKVRIDQEDDVLYFELDDTEIVESEKVGPSVIIDFDKDERLVGIEILCISKRFIPDKLRLMQFETV